MLLDFATELRHTGQVAVLALRGELDAVTVGRLRRALAEACKPRPSLVVLDLSGLQFLDSVSLSALVAARTEALSDGIRIVVAGAQPPVMRAFKVTSLLAPFDVQPHGAPWPWFADEHRRRAGAQRTAG